MTGKPLWRWRFSEPFVESATADTVTIRQGVNGKSSVYDIVTGGEVLADHLTDTQCLGGSDGRRVLVSQLDEDRGYMLRALDRAETVWEIGPLPQQPCGDRGGEGLRRQRAGTVTPDSQNASLSITATVPGSSASKTCSTSPGG